ncbi:MAG: type II toxin-antitoxin system MqsA family antitoxin [Anaerolineae bacterium]|nr:type II toxin-antitoxin system MqsA family antitoxin [Anaerolineae bacterium]
MRCVICKHGETQPGYTTVTLERGRTILVFKRVPAQVCANCGEAYVSEAVTEQLLQEAEEAAREQVWVGVRELTPVPV